MSTPTFKTEQEAFWHGQFGDEYVARNRSAHVLSTNLALFSRVLAKTAKIDSCLELGANVGMNLRALKLLLPECKLHAVEINANAAAELRQALPETNVINASILEIEPAKLVGQVDFAFSKGVLIHIAPERLGEVYRKLYEASLRYILVCEYYNPTPVAVEYRGHQDRLFKRDFAGEMLERYPDLVLLDYGFNYRREKNFPMDDTTWFLMEKRS